MSTVQAPIDRFLLPKELQELLEDRVKTYNNMAQVTSFLNLKFFYNLLLKWNRSYFLIVLINVFGELSQAYLVAQKLQGFNCTEIIKLDLLFRLYRFFIYSYQMQCLLYFKAGIYLVVILCPLKKFVINLILLTCLRLASQVSHQCTFWYLGH